MNAAEYIALAEVAKALPGNPNPSTVFRWTQRGLLLGGQRYRLQTVNVGRKLFTTQAWLDAFIAATTAARDAVATAEPLRFRLPRESQTLREMSLAAAMAKLYGPGPHLPRIACACCGGRIPVERCRRHAKFCSDACRKKGATE